jgi:glycosyltransferase involved in cell wall biosynthesis
VKITFLDPVGWDYNAETPLTQPLGGSQSALCYLATELACQGHEISIVNHITASGEYGGVRSLNWAESANAAFLNQADVVIVLNAALGHELRDRVGVRRPLVLWTQHAHDQPAMRELGRVFERKAWTGFAFISVWMRDHYLRTFNILRGRSHILHNGIAPSFVVHQPAPPWFETGAAPVLAYTSTPFRGLDVLIDAFPAIRSAFPELRLRVYSSMSIYRVAPEQDDYRPLYDRCSNMAGIDYIGPVGQVRLADELAGIAALAYPSTFAETFCIAAAEAMALGASLITTRLGALPELFGEFAELVELGSDRQQFVDAYAALVVDALSAMMSDPATAAARRQAQIAFIKERYTWPRIASEWSSWLDGLIGNYGDSAFNIS